MDVLSSGKRYPTPGRAGSPTIGMTPMSRFVDAHDEFITWFFDAGVRLRRALSGVELPKA